MHITTIFHVAQSRKDVCCPQDENLLRAEVVMRDKRLEFVTYHSLVGLKKRLNLLIVYCHAKINCSKFKPIYLAKIQKKKTQNDSRKSVLGESLSPGQKRCLVALCRANKDLRLQGKLVLVSNFRNDYLCKSRVVRPMIHVFLFFSFLFPAGNLQLAERTRQELQELDSQIEYHRFMSQNRYNNPPR